MMINTTTPARAQFSIERAYPASIDAAWALWTTKAGIESWWGPEGFNVTVTDVEHAAEDTTDNLVPLIALEPDNPRWEKWALQLGDFARDVWTGRNVRGELQFWVAVVRRRQCRRQCAVSPRSRLIARCRAWSSAAGVVWR